MSTSARSNCNTADPKNVGKFQQMPSSKISGNLNKIYCQKKEHGFQREFSDQHFLFFTRFFVIAIVEHLCLIKLIQTSWFQQSSSGDTRLTVCEEISIYFTILSTTLRFIVPSPESTKLVKRPKDVSAYKGQEPSAHLQEGEEEEDFKATETECADEAD